MNISKKLLTFAPIACRLLARRKTRTGAVIAMTDEDIKRASGLPTHTIKRLSWCLDWDDVAVPDMIRFTRGCGIDLDNRECVKANTRYLRQGTWRHIHQSPELNTLYRPLLKEWMNRN